MIPAYRPKYFRLEELVPKIEFSRYGERLWAVLDERALITLDQLREQFGRAVCNTWHVNGEFTLRGWRPATSTVGAVLSQHRFGRAFDDHVTDTPTAEARAYILANPDTFPLISCIELDTSWLHFDCRPHLRAQHGIFTFKP